MDETTETVLGAIVDGVNLVNKEQLLLDVTIKHLCEKNNLHPECIQVHEHYLDQETNTFYLKASVKRNVDVINFNVEIK